MPYYLKHHFDPSFDHTQLRPRELVDGRVDHYNMGYVQNVERGQVLAEWVDSVADAGETSGPPFVFEEKVFPLGKNTAVDPANPERLLAAHSGYAYYLNGKITVNRNLNVRRDVDFHTGNISFLGNVVVHGSIRSGFQVLGRNVLVKEVVGAAQVRAKESFQAEGGVKGGSRAIIKAGANLRVPFCENATLLAEGRMLIDGACMHSEVYAGEQLAVKGRLVGGQAVCTRLVYVGEQLGGGLGAETQIMVGYDALLLHKSRLVESKIANTLARLDELDQLIAKHPDARDELKAKKAFLQKRMKIFRIRHRELWDSIRVVENLEICRVVVPGKVRPGVEICIGEASLVVNDFLEDVCFTYKDYEIVVSSPALKK